MFNVTYKDLYEWLTCLQSNPCVGWLNSDEEIRNYTSNRAAELSNIYATVRFRFYNAYYF